MSSTWRPRIVTTSPVLAGLIVPLRRTLWQQTVDRVDTASVVVTVTVGAVTSAVGLDAVVPLPYGLVAVTWTRSRWPSSPFTTV